MPLYFLASSIYSWNLFISLIKPPIISVGLWNIGGSNKPIKPQLVPALAHTKIFLHGRGWSMMSPLMRWFHSYKWTLRKWLKWCTLSNSCKVCKRLKCPSHKGHMSGSNRATSLITEVGTKTAIQIWNRDKWCYTTRKKLFLDTHLMTHHDLWHAKVCVR